jgi:hypothetical protein
LSLALSGSDVSKKGLYVVGGLSSEEKEIPDNLAACSVFSGSSIVLMSNPVLIY